MIQEKRLLFNQKLFVPMKIVQKDFTDARRKANDRRSVIDQHIQLPEQCSMI